MLLIYQSKTRESWQNSVCLWCSNMRQTLAQKKTNWIHGAKRFYYSNKYKCSHLLPTLCSICLLSTHLIHFWMHWLHMKPLTEIHFRAQCQGPVVENSSIGSLSLHLSSSNRFISSGSLILISGLILSLLCLLELMDCIPPSPDLWPQQPSH